MRLHVLSSLQEDDDDTLIIFEEDNNMGKAAVTGVTFDKNQTRISVHGVPDKPGVTYQILDAVADTNVEVNTTIQNVGPEGTTDFSFIVPHGSCKQTLDLLSGLRDSTGATVIDDDDTTCKASAVGMGIHSHTGVVAKIFRTLVGEGINIRMISTSKIRVSALIDEKYMELATRVLYKAFGLGKQARIVNQETV